MIYYIYREQWYKSLLPLNEKCIFLKKFPFKGGKDEKWFPKSGKHDFQKKKSGKHKISP